MKDKLIKIEITESVGFFRVLLEVLNVCPGSALDRTVTRCKSQLRLQAFCQVLLAQDNFSILTQTN